MDSLFLQIINMSITSSYIILFIIIIRLLFKKVPKIFSYGLWLIPFLRLVLPFSFESVFSLVSINREAIPKNIIYVQTPQINTGIGTIDSAVNRILPASELVTSVNPIQAWIWIGSIIWLIGLVALLIYSIYSTFKLSKRLESATLVESNIYKIDTIKTPFVFGLIKPRIYLPHDLSTNEESYIIKHEETHIKRWDHLIKFIAFLIVSLHWFNPIVWIGFYLMGEDMELSCDESVIKEMGYGIKRDYSNSLLALSTGKRLIGGSPIAFGENNTRGRIKNILKYKEPKFWVIIISIVLLIFLALALLSNPPNDIRTGLYATDDNLSYLRIEEDKKFTFQRHIAMSYIPAGTYDIDGDKLLLYIDDNPKTATIEFTIEDDTLIFQSGELVDETIEKGSQFTFIGWNSDVDLSIIYEEVLIGHILDMDLDDHIFHLDQVELLGIHDEERAKELGFDVDKDMPGGYLIYNPETSTREYEVSQHTRYMLLDWTGNLGHDSVSKEEFIEYNNSLAYKPLYEIFMQDGYVAEIFEKYTP